jgi:transposase
MPKTYDPEFKARAVRLVRDHLSDYASVTAASVAVGAQLGVSRETLRRWVTQAEIDDGARSGVTSAEVEEIRRLKAENRRLREANKSVRDERAQYHKGTRPPRRREQLADGLVPVNVRAHVSSRSEDANRAMLVPRRARDLTKTAAQMCHARLPRHVRISAGATVSKGWPGRPQPSTGGSKDHWPRQACCCLLVRGLDEPEVLRRFGDEPGRPRMRTLSACF